jgi:hypothetical protein
VRLSPRSRHKRISREVFEQPSGAHVLHTADSSHWLRKPAGLRGAENAELTLTELLTKS